MKSRQPVTIEQNTLIVSIVEVKLTPVHRKYRLQLSNV